MGAADARRYYDDDEGDRAVAYFAEPIPSGYVLIEPDHLVNLTSLEPARWKRERPKVCRRMGIEQLALRTAGGSIGNAKSPPESSTPRG